MTHQATPQAPSSPAPLGFVLAVTFVLSIGTGSLTHGLHFIAKASGFERLDLFVLGFVFGVCYIASALLTGPVVRFLEGNRRTRVSPRLLLASLTVGAGVFAGLPAALEMAGRPSAWALWVVATTYGCITGLLWPLVEWYLSGGRRGRALRSAAGRFNITWTSAVVLAFFLLAPVLEEHPIEALWGVVVLHALAAALMIPFPKRPPKHVAEHLEHAEIDPERSRRLLASARVLLPVSYMLGGVLGPFFPYAFTRMGIEVQWQPIVAAVWMMTRIPAMLVFERWHGWHGRGWPLAMGGTLVGAGFVGCVLAPAIPASAGLPVLIASLASFGAGMGTVYTAAIYYAMEVGQGEVDSGAIHETLIGVGYALGPALGIVVSLGVAWGAIPPEAFNWTLVGLSVVACVGLAMLIVTLTRPGKGSSGPV